MESLLKQTDLPFHLIIIDCAMPARYRQAIDQVVGSHPQVEILRAAHVLTPNQSKNLVLNRWNGRTDYLCLVENDLIFEPGWLSRLVAAADTESAAAVFSPLILEPHDDGYKVHGYENIGFLQSDVRPEGRGLTIQRLGKTNQDRYAGRTKVDCVETHCLLWRRATLERLGPFDEELHTREHLDVSLRLQEAGWQAMVEPSACVVFHPPQYLEADEEEFYLQHWNQAAAQRSHERLRQRWQLSVIPPSIAFTQRRLQVLHNSREWRAVRELIATVAPAEGLILLADGGAWPAEFVAPARAVLPFTERAGRYHGPPADDASALRELADLRRRGARLIVFGPATFWWLDHYRRLGGYLRRQAHCRLATDQLMAFELEPPSSVSFASRQETASTACPP